MAAPPTQKSAARKMMIPPPPPHIPLLGGHQGEAMEFSTIGVPLDFMARPDLERMKKRLEDSNQQMSKKAAERTATINECRGRIVQFESLYTEGVVSKKDVKTAKKELQDAEETDNDIDQRLADVKTDLARVGKRLEALERENPKAMAAKKSGKPPLLAKPVKPMSSDSTKLKSVKVTGSKTVQTVSK